MRIFDRNPREEQEAYLEFVKQTEDPEPEGWPDSRIEFSITHPDGTREVVHPNRVTPIFSAGKLVGYEIATEGH